MSLLRVLPIASALLCGAPALAQEADSSVRVTATSDRPTLISYLGENPIPQTVDDLLAKLNEPDMCGKEGWPRPRNETPCAIIAYYLADRDETLRTPNLVFRAIQYITHPDDPAETALRIVDIDGQIQVYRDHRLDEPLRPMRVENSCRRVLKSEYNPPKTVKKCQKVNALYVPFGILGYIENDQQQILTGKTKDALFSLTLDKPDG